MVRLTKREIPPPGALARDGRMGDGRPAGGGAISQAASSRNPSVAPFCNAEPTRVATGSSVGKRICSAGQLVNRAPQPLARQRAALRPANPQLGSSRAWPAAERGSSPGRRRDLALRLIPQRRPERPAA